MSDIDDLRLEIARLINALNTIRDYTTQPVPRHPTFEWYRSIIDHVRRITIEALQDEQESNQ